MNVSMHACEFFVSVSGFVSSCVYVDSSTRWIRVFKKTMMKDVQLRDAGGRYYVGASQYSEHEKFVCSAAAVIMQVLF